MKKTTIKKLVIYTLIVLMCSTMLTGCVGQGSKKGYVINKDLDTSKTVNLVIGTSHEAWVEMDAIISDFEEIYPNCSIVCEYIEEYTTNLPVRLNQSENKIDIFRTVSIQSNTPYKDNSLNLLSEESKKILDLSGCNEGLVKNFRYVGEDNVQYAIPFGGEMRGMYVNVTLLKTLNLTVPTNRAELMNCFKVLYENGYIPLQGSNGTVAQQLLYPMICNSIVNGGKYTEMYNAIENIEDGVSEYLRDAYTLLYEIVEKGYFDYKRVEEELGYTFSSNEAKAREFLNIGKIAEDNYAKNDDIGKIAFVVDTQSFNQYLAKAKEDYHSEIEYKFIVAPVGEDGGYAYLSPSDALAINKNSDNVDWALEFLNYLFTPEVNTKFATLTNKIPNTKEGVLSYVTDSKHACDVGQVTFSYIFYKVVTPLMLGGYDDMIGMSKMNAKKYMIDNGDGTYSLKYTLEDYMTRLEAEFQKIKSER